VRWNRGQKSDNVIDRRGVSGRGIAIGGGGIGIIVALVLSLLGGGGGSSFPDIGDILGPAASPAAPVQPDNEVADDELEDFMRFVVDDVQQTWANLFEPAFDREYEETSLVLFTDGVQTACGSAPSAVGPFYCPADQLAYIDLTFYEELRDRFGAPGDFAQAYVIAHEIGHHVQNLLGTNERTGGSNEGSIRLELQADCYAGIWGNAALDAGVLEDGDVEEGLDAAAAVGDDRIQQQSGGDIDRESWTHGSSEQRVAAFQQGFQSGDPRVCDDDVIGP
jgi:uncharacterized protein